MQRSQAPAPQAQLHLQSMTNHIMNPNFHHILLPLSLSLDMELGSSRSLHSHGGEVAKKSSSSPSRSPTSSSLPLQLELRPSRGPEAAIAEAQAVESTITSLSGSMHWANSKPKLPQIQCRNQAHIKPIRGGLDINLDMNSVPYNSSSDGDDDDHDVAAAIVRELDDKQEDQAAAEEEEKDGDGDGGVDGDGDEVDEAEGGGGEAVVEQEAEEEEEEEEEEEIEEEEEEEEEDDDDVEKEEEEVEEEEEAAAAAEEEEEEEEEEVSNMEHMTSLDLSMIDRAKKRSKIENKRRRRRRAVSEGIGRVVSRAVIISERRIRRAVSEAKKFDTAGIVAGRDNSIGSEQKNLAVQIGLGIGPDPPKTGAVSSKTAVAPANRTHLHQIPPQIHPQIPPQIPPQIHPQIPPQIPPQIRQNIPPIGSCHGRSNAAAPAARMGNILPLQAPQAHHHHRPDHHHHHHHHPQNLGQILQTTHHHVAKPNHNAHHIHNNCSNIPNTNPNPNRSPNRSPNVQQNQQNPSQNPNQNHHHGSCEVVCSDEDGDGASARKKLRLSKEQSALLEESFREHSTLNPKQKNALAKQLNLRARQVEVWFQNRRARTKLKQTEVDCELLKRCCESLTEENRRLHKEVAELRALKAVGNHHHQTPASVPVPVPASSSGVPDFYSRPLAATMLTMCPSCERMGPGHSSPPPGPAAAAHNSVPFQLKPPFALSFSPRQQSSAAC